MILKNDLMKYHQVVIVVICIQQVPGFEKMYFF